MREVMLVDDDEMVVFLHKVILAEAGFSNPPVVAHSGDEALAYLQTASKDPQKEFLLLLDINMAGMNAWQLLDEIKLHSLEDQVKAVIVSSSIDKKDKAKAKACKNVIDYVEKPLDVDYCKQLNITLAEGRDLA